jgi:hypothetical protein
MSGICIPPRYRVRLSDNFRPELPAQVEVDLLPTGIFGVQDGRTPRRAEAATLFFDQKSGDFVVQEPTGEPMVLDPVALEGISLGIGLPVTVAGNRLLWTQPETATGARSEATATIEARIDRLVAVLPMLGYRRRTPMSVATIFVKQESRVVGWAELIAVNVVTRPYHRKMMEEELLAFDSWLRTSRVDTARWWAMVYFGRAMRHREAAFLDDAYAEIIINLWKAAEAILGTHKLGQVQTAARSLGLPQEVVREIKWLYVLRHSDDVAHAVISRKESAKQLEALQRDRHENVRRAESVVRAVIDHALTA